ncbi:MAG: alpha/beta fold hydrolase, partial [Deinococcales bacterium]
MTVLGLAITAVASNGTTVEAVVHSVELEHNLLGDSPDRTVSIYLPPGYSTDTNTLYPVLYLLHGYGEDNNAWLLSFNVSNAANTLITNRSIQPLIIVMPDARNAYGGSYYVNSPVTGNWEDFIARDLVSYIDTHYRTIPRPESRALAGYSMGGFGALYIATKHADTFRVVYAMNPYATGLVGTDEITFPFFVLATEKAIANDAIPTNGNDVLALAAAFSPNPDNPPAYVDLPYESIDNKPHKIDAVWNRWLSHTPLAMIDTYTANLRQYTAIAFDAGTGDIASIRIDAPLYSQALTRAGIPHRFEVYEGGHTDKLATRMESVVLPFVSRHLEGST